MDAELKPIGIYSRRLMDEINNSGEQAFSWQNEIMIMYLFHETA